MTELVMHYLTIVLLFVSLGIFGWLAIKSHSIRTFQFQISIFIIIWIVGEIVNIVISHKTEHHIEDIGPQIHLAAMVLFAVLLWTRFYYSRLAGKKIVDDSSDYYLG
jgi:uncharacterized membrane protein